MGMMLSGTDQSRTDHLRGFRPAVFQLSYGPRCPVSEANVGQERAGGGNRTRSSWVEARYAATSTSPAGQSNLEWMAGLEPASARRQRAALPLSYTHVDGRRDGIRTRAGLSPDRFAGGRLRLLGHSALAAEEGLEPPIYRLTAGRCASSATPQGPQLRDHPARVGPARLGRAGTAGGSRTRDLLGECQACCRSTTAARLVPSARVERAPCRLGGGCSLH